MPFSNECFAHGFVTRIKSILEIWKYCVALPAYAYSGYDKIQNFWKGEIFKIFLYIKPYLWVKGLNSLDFPVGV